jgi:hypothetical protein
VPGSELRGVESCRPPLQLQPHELVVRGIGDFSAHRIIGNELCVKDTSGQTCLTRSQVDLMLAASAAASAQALGDGAGAPTTAPTSGEPSASTTSSSTSASLVVETTPPSGRSIKSGTTTSAPSSPTTANPKRSTQPRRSTRPSPAPPPSTTGPLSRRHRTFSTQPAMSSSRRPPTITLQSMPPTTIPHYSTGPARTPLPRLNRESHVASTPRRLPHCSWIQCRRELPLASPVARWRPGAK